MCGAMGVVEPKALDTLLSFGPAVHKMPISLPNCSLWLTNGPHYEISPPFTAVLDSGKVTSRDWLGIANEEQAGLSVDRHEARLFASALGFRSVYYRLLGRAVVFASTPYPLIELGDVSTDWEAWADILALGYPLGSSTQLREIRRLEAGSSLVFDGSGCRMETFKPHWWEIEERKSDPREVVATVESAVPRLTLKKPAATLSGGWDSRLLGSILVRRSLRKPDAFTIAKDDGSELDIELSPPVASALGMKQTLLSQPDDMTGQERSFRGRVFHETWMHTWLEPLADRLRKARRLVVDGIGGDVLIKALHVPYEVADARDAATRVLLVHGSLTKEARLADDDIWAPGIGKWLLDTTTERLMATTMPIFDHPALPSLTVLLNRTARGISLSPFWMFGPECSVLAPFLDQGVVRMTLAIPLEEKLGGDYYRRVLEASSGQLAALPSTNDVTGSGRLPRRQLSTENLAYHLTAISRSPDAVGLLPSELRALLEAPQELAVHPKLGRWHRLLKLASLISDWQVAHASRLRDVGTAPWLG